MVYNAEMMKKLIISLTLALSFSFVNAEKYPALKVKDYKNVKVVVERMDTDSNTGITAKDIENKIKLTLLRNGFKLSEQKGKDYIYINLNLMPVNDKVNDVYKISILYEKLSFNHFDTVAEQDAAGLIFTPDQGVYESIGIANKKSTITSRVNDHLEKFLVDYMESNIE